MKQLITSIFFQIVLYSITYSQNTVGTTINTSDAFDGYTLFSPNSSNTSFLINNCGQVVNSWQGTNNPGLMAYLMEDGSLIRTGRINNSTFTQGGVGGHIEILDWNGNQTWSFQYSNDSVAQHHDIEVLPNGNILILATEFKSLEKCIAAGRDTAKIQGNALWPEHIVEVEIIGQFFNIVWEWHAWDHLVQNFDSSKANFGDPAEHPELFDLNYYKNQGPPDWQHFNSIDYNAELDQILLSSKTWSEIYIIDHSTNSSQAASHSGGNSGVGGDIMYRWGNPITYGAGNVSDQTLFDQHDANWIETGLPNEGEIIVFNNQYGADFSSVDIFSPPLNSGNTYDLTSGKFGPDSAFWKYTSSSPSDMFSPRISGAHVTENGNILICSGVQGTFWEVDSNMTVVWQYVNPVANSGISSQGDTPSNANQVFRAIKYPPSYTGLVGKDLTPSEPIELDYNLDNCQLINLVTLKETDELFNVFPNPFSTHLSIQQIKGSEIRVINNLGQEVLKLNSVNEIEIIDLSQLPDGVYTIKAGETIQKVIKTN